MKWLTLWWPVPAALIAATGLYWLIDNTMLFGLVPSFALSNIEATTRANWGALGDVFGGILNPLLTLFTIILLIRTIWISQETLKASQQQLDTTRDIAERQLRAYIYIDSASIEFTEPGRAKSKITYKNYGQTPAHDVQIWIHQWAHEYPLTIDLPVPPHDFIMSKSVLGPGAFHYMVNETPRPVMKKPYLDLVGTKEGTIYVYGEISYKDIFGKSHIQKYRLMYGGDEPVIPGALKPCIDGNEST